MSLYSAKINSKDHNCLMVLVSTEFCMALTDIPSPEREEEEETVRAERNKTVYKYRLKQNKAKQKQHNLPN